MTKTIFERIVDKEIPSYKIYEDEKHYAFLDINPFEKGHTLVIPKKAYLTIFEMPEDEFLDLMKVVQKIAIHFNEILGCDVNIWQNNGPRACQEVPHVHFHVVPRMEHKRTYHLENVQKYLKGEAENYVNRLKFN